MTDKAAALESLRLTRLHIRRAIGKVREWVTLDAPEASEGDKHRILASLRASDELLKSAQNRAATEHRG